MQEDEVETPPSVGYARREHRRVWHLYNCPNPATFPLPVPNLLTRLEGEAASPRPHPTTMEWWDPRRAEAAFIPIRGRWTPMEWDWIHGPSDPASDFEEVESEPGVLKMAPASRERGREISLLITDGLSYFPRRYRRLAKPKTPRTPFDLIYIDQEEALGVIRRWRRDCLYAVAYISYVHHNDGATFRERGLRNRTLITFLSTLR